MATLESNQPTILILADDREAASPVPEALRLKPGVEVRLQRLSVGDYEVDHRCVFERKTLLDFAESVVDGRLFTQARRLAQLPIPSAIILEGRSAQLATSQIRREALQGALISLSLIFRLPVLRALDPVETAHLIVYAAQQLRAHELGEGVRAGRRPSANAGARCTFFRACPASGPCAPNNYSNASAACERS